MNLSILNFFFEIRRNNVTSVMAIKHQDKIINRPKARSDRRRCCVWLTHSEVFPASTSKWVPYGWVIAENARAMNARWARVLTHLYWSELSAASSENHACFMANSRRCLSVIWSELIECWLSSIAATIRASGENITIDRWFGSHVNILRYFVVRLSVVCSSFCLFLFSADHNSLLMLNGASRIFLFARNT